MKNGWNKKIIIGFSIAVLLLTTGYGFWEDIPNLINADEPFVNLSGSIGESIGSANEAYNKAMVTSAPDDVVPTITPEPTDIPEINTLDGNEIMIIIGDEDYAGSGEIITISGAGFESVKILSDSLESMKNILSNKINEGIVVVIVDNYAETKTFKSLKKMLDDVGINYQIRNIG